MVPPIKSQSTRTLADRFSASAFCFLCTNVICKPQTHPNKCFFFHRHFLCREKSRRVSINLLLWNNRISSERRRPHVCFRLVEFIYTVQLFSAKRLTILLRNPWPDPAYILQHWTLNSKFRTIKRFHRKLIYIGGKCT